MYTCETRPTFMSDMTQVEAAVKLKEGKPGSPLPVKVMQDCRILKAPNVTALDDTHDLSEHLPFPPAHPQCLQCRQVSRQTPRGFALIPARPQQTCSNTLTSYKLAALIGPWHVQFPHSGSTPLASPPVNYYLSTLSRDLLFSPKPPATMKSLTVLSTLCSIASAHFILKYPKGAIFDDDTESQGPCGGSLPDFSKTLTDFHVGGDALAMKFTHPQGDWLFRVTTDQKAESGWEQIFPIVQQSGMGDFCEPAVTVPSSYSGKKGILSVVSSATDGMLYQCVAVNFVQGKVDAPKECNNGTIKASFVENAQLSALVGGSSASSPTASSPSSASGTKTASTSTSTQTGAAASLQSWAFTGAGWGTAMVALCMATLGGALAF
ncbi:hypothetical protein E4U55_002111 [Claviceps digitariae]|nr:hypothetical protein E4U55_002111 [Claviceps digitariae]